MNSNYLFPNYFKKPALVVFVLSIIFGLYILYINEEPEWLKIRFQHDKYIFNSEHLYMGYTIAGVLLILSAVIFAFSKEKDEDEYIAKIRLESLVWATYINYGLLLISFLVIYGLGFINVMLYNMFTLLIFFIIRFNFYKYKLQRSLKDEE